MSVLLLLLMHQTVQLNTVLISWELYSRAPHNPSSFRVQWQHRYRMELFVDDGNLTQVKLKVGDLFSSSSYDCCVSAIYYNYGKYVTVTERRCTSTDMSPTDSLTTPTPNEMLNQPFTIPTSTPMIQSNSSMAPASVEFISSDMNNMRDSIVTGGVLGSIIVILLLLLVICEGALLYLLRSRSVIPKRQRSSNAVDNNSAGIPNNAKSSIPADRKSTDMPVGRNLSYETTTPQSTTDGTQATQASTLRTTEGETDAAAEYSRIGPSYASIDSRRQQPVAGRNVASARLSERYEFSEAHLAAAAGGGGGGGGGGQEESAVDYEVPLNISQNEELEEYSRLRH